MRKGFTLIELMIVIAIIAIIAGIAILTFWKAGSPANESASAQSLKSWFPPAQVASLVLLKTKTLTLMAVVNLRPSILMALLVTLLTLVSEARACSAS